MIVILCEERSMRDTLTAIFARHFQDKIEGVDWQVIAFQGKADLEKNATRKMRSWSYNDPHFIYLRDNDGADCRALKARLMERLEPAGKVFHVRLVCQELESWLLGELPAVEAAFPSSRATSFSDTAKYRNPDILTNASEELTKLTGTSGKISRASLIAPHLKLVGNRSTSLQVFLRTLTF